MLMQINPKHRDQLSSAGMTCWLDLYKKVSPFSPIPVSPTKNFIKSNIWSSKLLRSWEIIFSLLVHYTKLTLGVWYNFLWIISIKPTLLKMFEHCSNCTLSWSCVPLNNLDVPLPLLLWMRYMLSNRYVYWVETSLSNCKCGNLDCIYHWKLQENIVP